METVFIQRIECDGVEVPVALMLSGTYIETVTLDSPKLIVKLADMDGGIRDSLGVREGKELTVSFSDVTNENGVSFVDKFTVVNPIHDGDTLILEALQSDVYRLKQHLPNPRFFVDKSPQQILSELLPSLSINLVNVAGRGTYHVHNGVTPSFVLNQMARDYGALLFVCRGEVNMIAIDDLPVQPVIVNLESNNPQAEKQIWSIAQPFSSQLIKRKKERRFIAWHENDGIVNSNNPATSAAKIITGNAQGLLDNANKHLIPIITFETSGSSIFKPAKRVRIAVNRLHQQKPIDESIEPEQSIVRVIYHQQGFSFICNVTVGRTNAE